MGGTGGNGMTVWAGGASNCNPGICKWPLHRMVYDGYTYIYTYSSVFIKVARSSDRCIDI